MDRQILFNAQMVVAVMSGKKTQTRRVAKGVHIVHERTGEALAQLDSAGPRIPSPYGQPGDRLWVRETFFAWGRWETRYSAKKGRDEWHFVDMTLECGKAYEYPATGGQPQPMGGARHRGGTTPTWWKRPAIHMPRAASRITLEITSVRVERLQAISEADAAAEGLLYNTNHMGHWSGTGERWYSTAREAFRDLWHSINGPESWDANPWAWVVEFKHVKGQQ